MMSKYEFYENLRTNSYTTFQIHDNSYPMLSCGNPGNLYCTASHPGPEVTIID